MKRGSTTPWFARGTGLALAALCILVLSLAGVREVRAQESPPLQRLPAEWRLPPVTSRPSLLLTDPSRLRRLLQAPQPADGVLGHDAIIDRSLLAYARKDPAEQKVMTEAFIEYWRKYASRWTREALNRDEPDGVVLRGIWRSIYLYDVVASFGLLDEAETQTFRDTLAERVQWAIGPDRAHRRVPKTPGWRAHNIYADVMVAAGVLGLAFPELPESREWVEDAVVCLDWQLENVVWDGAWHESPRYHGHWLTTTGLFYTALKNRTGVDLFQDPRLKGMLDWLVRFQTPMDALAGARVGLPAVAMTPAIGDSSWTNLELTRLAAFAPQYATTDPAFAARLMWAWQRGAGGYQTEWADALVDPTIRPAPQSLGSDVSPGKGYVVMRSGFDTADEVWFLLRCGKATRSGHDNGDWNAFNLHAFGTPLALDSASGDYRMREHKAWHDTTAAHNTVVFSGRTQERRDGAVLAFATSPELDYSVTDASAPAGVERFVRHVVFVKPDYLVIWDDIAAAEPAEWRLLTPAPADQIHSVDRRIRCWTPWRAGLDVHLLLPEASSLPAKPGRGRLGDWSTEGGRKRDLYPFDYQSTLGISAQPGEDFVTILHPIRAQDAPALITRIETEVDTLVLHIAAGEQHDTIRLNRAGVHLNRRGPVTCTATASASRIVPPAKPVTR